MLKVKSSVLTKEDSVTYFMGTRFSGMAFYIAADGKIDKIINYLNGSPIGDYQPIPEYNTEWLSINERTPRVDADLLLSGADSYTGEPYLHNGEVFTGIAYRFRGAFCTDEILYLEGFYTSLEIGTEWYISGGVESLDLYGQCDDRCRLSENYGFFEDGSFRGGGIGFVEYPNGKHKYTGISMSINQERQLNGIDISDRYFERVDEFYNRFKYPFHFVACKCELTKYRCAPFTSISGNGVDDEVFDYIESNRGLEILEHLNLQRTNLSPELIISLKELSKLKKLWITDEREATEAVARSIKQQRPDMEVMFNNDVRV